MKRIKFLCFLTLLLITACNNDNNNGPADGNCELKYTVDGQQFTSNPIVCAFLDGTMNLGLIGSNTIHLQINEINNTGTVVIPDDVASITVDLEDDTRLIMVEGVINVTSLNNNSSKGNFSGTMREISDFTMTGPTYSLTNGSFSASFSN